jgi:hypothetical protein
MPSGAGTRLIDKFKPVPALTSTAPSASTPTLVSMKGYGHLTAIVTGKNTTGVTGSAITLAQSKTVAGANSKALGFTYVAASTDIANSVALTNTAVASNTFTTTNTANAIFMYVIEVDATSLDQANGFDVINVATANATNSTMNVVYLLGSPARYGGASADFMNPLID